MKGILKCAFLVVCVTGCLNNNYVLTNNERYTSKPSDCPIKTYTTAPSKSFEEIGVIEFDVPIRIQQIDYVYVEDREFICEHGANAILYQNLDDENRYRTASVLVVSED